jgi:hypothetical protein
MDDGQQGPFSTIYLTNTRTQYTVTSGIKLGLQYRFRFSVSNVNGVSEFSDVSYIFALSPPSVPPKPTFISATSSNVKLGFKPSAFDYGTKITAYKLFVDIESDNVSTFT